MYGGGGPAFNTHPPHHASNAPWLSYESVYDVVRELVADFATCGDHGHRDAAFSKDQRVMRIDLGLPIVHSLRSHTPVVWDDHTLVLNRLRKPSAAPRASHLSGRLASRLEVTADEVIEVASAVDVRVALDRFEVRVERHAKAVEVEWDPVHRLTEELRCAILNSGSSIELSRRFALHRSGEACLWVCLVWVRARVQVGMLVGIAPAGCCLHPSIPCHHRVSTRTAGAGWFRWKKSQADMVAAFVENRDAKAAGSPEGRGRRGSHSGYSSTSDESEVCSFFVDSLDGSDEATGVPLAQQLGEDAEVWLEQRMRMLEATMELPSRQTRRLVANLRSHAEAHDILSTLFPPTILRAEDGHLVRLDPGEQTYLKNTTVVRSATPTDREERRARNEGLVATHPVTGAQRLRGALRKAVRSFVEP